MMTMASCAPKAQNKKFTNLNEKQYSYEPRNQDKALVSALSNNFDIQSVIGLGDAEKNQTPWIDNSAEIFKLAENSMVLGDLIGGEERVQYRKFGHDLMRLFYQSKENTTQFDKTQTLYLPVALGYEGTKIKSMFSDLGSPQNIEGVKVAFNSIHIRWPDEQPTLRPVGFIISIRNYLDQIPSAFSKNKVSPKFVKSFSDQLDKDYTKSLSDAVVSLQNIDQNQKLKINAEVISSVIKTLSFIPQNAVKALVDNLVKAKNYAQLIEVKHPSGETQVYRLVKVIASIWLDLTPPQREKYIKSANEMLYTKLNETSEKMLKWLAGRYQLELTDKEYYYGTFFKDGFADRLDTSCHGVVHTDLNTWLKMNDAEKANFRQNSPELFAIFSRYTNDEIKDDILSYFSDGTFEEPFAGGGTVKKFNSEVLPICISRIQALLDKSITLYLLSELDIQIRNLGSLIEKAVADKTIGSLTDIASSLDSDDKFKVFFEKMAYPIMDQVMFDNGTLNGIENSKVQLYVDNKNQFSTRRSTMSEFDTGAEVLGTSMAASYRRFQGMPEFENKPANSKDYYRVVFGQINKMLSMVGFRTMDGKLVRSLTRNFYGDIPEFDVCKYDCNKKKLESQREMKKRYAEAILAGQTPNPDDFIEPRDDCEGYETSNANLYEIPDQLLVQPPFVPGAYKKYSSIRGQSEIIRGAALMMNYFNDWRGPTGFDQGLGQLKFTDVNLFPKNAFVNLSIGVMTAPIRGLQKENTPLVLFNMENQEIKGWVKNGIPDPTSGKPIEPSQQIIQAAIVDLLASGPSKIVKTEDMAYFMVAINEFLKSTEGIAASHSTIINPPLKTSRDNLEALTKGRKLLKLMMFAMSNFMVNRMQDDDGGFWSYYDLENNKIVRKEEPRTLRVQLAAINALLKVYEQWGGEGSLITSTEAYYFMNQKLWSEKSSFYRADESSASLEVKPDLYLDAVMNFKNLEPFLRGQSAVQAKTMFDYYSKEFLKWNKSSQPMAQALN